MIRWSVNALATESGMDRRTVQKRIRRVKPIGDGPRGPVYSGPDAFPAMFDIAVDEVETSSRKMWAEAELRELEMLQGMKKVIPEQYIREALAIVYTLARHELKETSEVECFLEKLSEKAYEEAPLHPENQ